MPKSYAFFLLLCLTVPPAATYSWLRIEKHRVRKMVKRQMIAGLPEEELVLLAFSMQDAARQLRWEHGREFEYQGQMYDVVHTVQKGDTIYYRCWPDLAETNLNRRLALLVEQALHHHPQTQDTCKNIYSWGFSSGFTRCA